MSIESASHRVASEREDVATWICKRAREKEDEIEKKEEDGTYAGRASGLYPRL
jgi:hypothetical protein